jgi:hypothetical protein
MRRVVAVALVALLATAGTARAVRPLLTDDAGVVGKHRLQLESWIAFDRNAGAHWSLVTFGPLRRLEVMTGALYGVSWQNGVRFALAAPILQGKLQLVEGRRLGPPDVAIAAGATLPFGVADLRAQKLIVHSYLAASEDLLDDDRLTLHANLGFTVEGRRVAPIVGFAVQARLDGKLYGTVDVFVGDPFFAGSGGVVQVAAVYEWTEHVQLDATIGSKLWGDSPPVFGTIGLRLLTGRLW